MEIETKRKIKTTTEPIIWHEEKNREINTIARYLPVLDHIKSKKKIALCGTVYLLSRTLSMGLKKITQKRQKQV